MSAKTPGLEGAMARVSGASRLRAELGEDEAGGVVRG